MRRPAGSWTRAVHDPLAYLGAAGFAGAPRVLGVDELDREILGFVPGRAGTLSATEPVTPWSRGPGACWSIGRWIRQFQSAQAGFAPDPTKPWRRAPGGVLRPGQVIAHHDVSPYNTVRRDDGSLVVQDRDFARPGDPIDDLAWVAWRWAPLMTGTWWHREYGISDDQDIRTHHRRSLAALLDGYGPPSHQRDILPDAIAEQMSSHAADLEDMAKAGPAFADLIDRGYARAARDDARWWRTATIRPE